ncbi:MAG TPA: YiiX/YebB-like N1pC/P60 family cysteine hydrolase [Chitinophagaceae bacterium]|nr:YiiX/YebB-like N1pC/P60 family cysteine hydrolase [Chitinophagaceae bacterium]
MKAFILILLVSYSFYSCISHARKQESIPAVPAGYVDPSTLIHEGQALLKEGDLVVRLNQDPASQFIKNFNRQDKKYSHAGIVLFENGYPFIYHIVNGEENPDEKLRKDSLSWFCNPRKNLAYGIYRYELGKGEIKRLKALIHKWHAKGVQFDHGFDLKTDDKMYCSEMVRKALETVTDKRISIETTDLSITEAGVFSAYMHLPLTYTSKLKIVSIDNLYKTMSCKLIKEYNYKIQR